MRHPREDMIGLGLDLPTITITEVSCKKLKVNHNAYLFEISD